MTELCDLPPSVMTQICAYLESSDVLQVRAASKHLLEFCTTNGEADIVWREALHRDFGFDLNGTDHYLKTLGIRKEQSQDDTVKTSIFGYTILDDNCVFMASSAFESWKHWSKADAIFQCHGRSNNINNGRKNKIHAYFFLRAAAVWNAIGRWCMSDISGLFGNVLFNTLASGVSRRDGRFPLNSDFKTVHAMEALFAFCDGQNALTVAAPFFGAYSFYDHQNSTILLSTDHSSMLRSALNLRLDESVISFNFDHAHPKWTRFNSSLGTFCVQCRGLDDLPVYKCNESDSEAEVGLLWMEEFARRLEQRHYEINPSLFNTTEDGTPFGLLSLFPTVRSPLSSRKVTRGIEVVASSLAAVEILTVTYSIRIRLLSQGEEGYLSPDQRGFETCQLKSRHWEFYNDSTNTVDRVSGDAVVGRYPLLFDGGYRDDHYVGVRGKEVLGVFQYESCAGISSGNFSGQLKFIPGSIRDPSGDPFFVDVGKVDINLLQDINY